MTPAEGLALRCVLPGFEGTQAPEWVIRGASEGLGGVVLFARNVESRAQLTALNEELHRARPELLIAIDEEGGDVTRVEARTGSSYPGNLALGIADDIGLTRRVGAAIGAELSAVGIDLNLAPVVDVNTNPQNPIIGVRSFGADSKAVARHAAAWVEGLQSAGVAACAKHFPGHGDTSIDSHLELPVAKELVLQPFAAAIAGGVRAVMSAHIVVRDLDPEPATASRRLMSGVLRDELGFAGVAISDGLEMRGFTPDGDIPAGAVRAVRAGCDALVIGGGLAGEEVVDEIVRALVAGVEERRLREAAARIDALAAWRRAQAPAGEPDRSVGQTAARRAVCRSGDVVVGEQATVVRFPAAASIAAGEVPWGVAEPLAARDVRVNEIEFDPAAHDLTMLLRAGIGRSLVLVVRDLHRRPEQLQLVNEILERRPDAVLVEMGVPTCRPRNAAAYVATHGSARVCGEAAAQVLRP